MRLLRFLWDFVIGDDWRIAAGVAVALALTAAFEWWWLLPLAVAALLVLVPAIALFAVGLVAVLRRGKATRAPARGGAPAPEAG